MLPLRFGRQGASWTSVCTLKKTGERHVATEWHMLFFQQVRRAWHGFRIVRVYVLLYRLYYGTAKCFVRFGNAGSQVWVWFNLIGPTVLRSTRRSPKVHGTRLQKQDLSVGDCTSPDAKNGKGACGQGFLVEWTCLQGSLLLNPQFTFWAFRTPGSWKPLREGKPSLWTWAVKLVAGIYEQPLQGSAGEAASS